MQVYIINSNSQTSYCQYCLFSKKNSVIWIFCLSRWLVIPFNLDKWCSTVLEFYIHLFYSRGCQYLAKSSVLAHCGLLDCDTLYPGRCLRSAGPVFLFHFIPTYQSVWCHNSENHNTNVEACGNLKYQIWIFFYEDISAGCCERFWTYSTYCALFL
jgi:hypothetical protein